MNGSSFIKKRTQSESGRGKAQGVFNQIDIGAFIEAKKFSEVHFRDSVKHHDWQQYRDQRVLVKPCGAGPVPPWAFMLVMAQLVPVARSIAYGENCSPVAVYRRKGESEEANSDEVLSRMEVEP